MKRIISLLLITAMLVSVLGCYIYAGIDYIEPNPEITANITSPKVDGDITKTEGWSDPAYMNEDTLSYYYRKSVLNIFAEVYFAIDGQGFYYAADIRENINNYAPGSDSYDPSDSMMPGLVYSDFDSNRVARDGDCFSIGIDVLDIMRTNPGADISERYQVSPNYGIYIYEDGKLRMFGFDPNGSSTDITDKVSLNGFATDGGWCFEAFIPWQIIIDDIEWCTKQKESPKVQDIINDGSVIRACAGYHDVRLADGGERKIVYNKYATTSDTKYQRVSYPHTQGIKINISNTCKYSGPHRWSEWIGIKDATYFLKGREASICNRCGKIIYRDVDILEYRNSFADVKDGSWYAEGVKYCVMKGYMNGMSDTCFAPNSMLTREQCVLILANLLDVDTSRYMYRNSGFKDVPTGRWYSGAVTWAKLNGIVSGMSEDTFGRGQYIKRDAFARLLYATAECMGMPMEVRADLSNYVDYADLPSWANEEMSWAVASNIILSTKDDILMLSPRDNVKRAQCATMLWQMGLLYETNN